MNDAVIPADVRDFLLKHIDAVAQLEALLLLRKYPARSWTAAALAGRLYVPEGLAGEMLARLAADGLCERDEGSFRYGPGALGGLVDRLAEAYAGALIPVTNIIHGKTARIQHFADAFRFRKDK